jgi:pimeloyl-ACP methyl ester carboxylesterase
MSTWQSGEVLVNGLRLHYTRTGGNKPPLVLSHGVTDDGLCWTPFAQALEDDYDMLMVDARGHGRSETSPTGFGPLQQAADLAGVIEALSLHQPILLGHSMGAVTTLVLAGTYPAIPRAILLEDPPDWWMPHQPLPPGQVNPHATIAQWITALKSKPKQQIIAEQRLAAPGWSEAELQPWAEAKLRCSLEVLSIFKSNPGAEVDWPAVLGSLACPALLLTADPALGAVVTPASAQALQAQVPQLEIAHIPGAGHNIRREQFERYLAAVRAFLHKHVQ